MGTTDDTAETTNRKDDERVTLKSVNARHFSEPCQRSLSSVPHVTFNSYRVFQTSEPDL